MDIFRKIFGLPSREDQTPFTPRDEFPPEGPIRPGDYVDDDDELHEHPAHGLFGQMDQEIREMERHMKDMWSMFGMGPRLFTEDFRKLFEGFDAVPGIPGEAMPALPAPEAEPKKDEADSLRKNMFKPSFLPPATSPDQRKDQDLDSKVQKEGISALLEEEVPESRQPVAPFQFRNFSRSVSIQTIRKPDGTLETRRVERDSDGNEVVTITEHPTDGNPPGFSGPWHGNHFFGHFGTPPDFFGSHLDEHPPHGHWSHDPSDPQGLSIFGKIFGRF